MTFVFKHPSKYKKNPTLVKNMKHVKRDQIPPLSGPDPRGLIEGTKQGKQERLENINGRYRQITSKRS
mgnify:CR=1 FL=1